MTAIKKLIGREKRIHWEVTLQKEVGRNSRPAVPGGGGGRGREGGAERAGQFLCLLMHLPTQIKNAQKHYCTEHVKMFLCRYSLYSSYLHRMYIVLDNISSLEVI